MNPEEIRDKIRTRLLGREIYYFDSVDSTNRTAKKFATEGAPEGSIVLAEEQTSGRGRLGREWISEPGKDLTFSLILRPEIEPSRLGLLSLFASVGVATAVGRLTGKQGECKWPNDVLLSGKKICGILSESVIQTGSVTAVIVGIGLNVNREKFPSCLAGSATSLRLEAGKPVDTGEALAVVLGELERRYGFGREKNNGPNDFSAIIEEWTGLNCILGKRIIVEKDDRRITGTATSITPEGGLIVETDGGTRHVFAGDVHLL